MSLNYRRIFDQEGDPTEDARQRRKFASVGNQEALRMALGEQPDNSAVPVHGAGRMEGKGIQMPKMTPKKDQRMPAGKDKSAETFAETFLGASAGANPYALAAKVGLRALQGAREAKWRDKQRQYQADMARKSAMAQALGDISANMARIRI